MPVGTGPCRSEPVHAGLNLSTPVQNRSATVHAGTDTSPEKITAAGTGTGPEKMTLPVPVPVQIFRTGSTSG